MSLGVSEGVGGGGFELGWRVKQHSITMIVIPEEFLPPLEKEGGDLLFFLESLHDHHRRPQIEYLVQEITQRLKVSNKIQTGRIKFPQISNAQIYNVLKKVIVRTVTTFLFSSAKHK